MKIFVRLEYFGPALDNIAPYIGRNYLCIILLTEVTINFFHFRNYNNPQISRERLEQGSFSFVEAVLSVLKCKATKVAYIAVVSLEHDIVRHVFTDKGKVAADGKSMLCEKDDFSRFLLPQYWHYYLNELGEGISVDFPIKLRTVLGYSPKRFIVNNDNKLIEGPKSPTEKVSLVINRRACDLNNV